MSALRLAVRSPALRLVGTAVAVVVLLHGIDLGRAGDGLRHADPRLTLLGTTLTGLGVLCTVAGWGILVRGLGHRIAWRRLGSWYLQAVFVGHVAPTGAAGDALRVLEVGRVAGPGRGLASLAVSRMASTLGMALFGAVGAAVLHSAFGVPVVAGAAAFLGFMVLSWFLAFRLHRVTRACQGRRSRLFRRAGHGLAPFTEAFDAFRRVPEVLAACVVVGIAGWGVNLLALQSFAAAVSVHAAWSVFAVAVPFSLLAATVPVAVNGIGIREGVLVGMLAHLGIDASHAGALAILLDLQLVPFALVGGALALHRRRRSPAAVAAVPVTAAPA